MGLRMAFLGWGSRVERDRTFTGQTRRSRRLLRSGALLIVSGSMLLAAPAASATWATPLGVSGQVAGLATDANGDLFGAFVAGENTDPYNAAESDAVVSPTGNLVEDMALGRQVVGGQAFSPWPLIPAGAVSSDAAGDALFGWTSDASDKGTAMSAQVRQRNPTGAMGPIITASPTSHNVYLEGVGTAADGSGLVLALDKTTGRITLRALSASGTLGAIETVTKPSGGPLRYATLHEFPNGDALIAWVRDNDNSQTSVVVQARFRLAGGQWGVVRTLSNRLRGVPSGANAPAPIVTGDSTDDGLVAWGSWDGKNVRARARKITPQALSPTVWLTPRGENAYPTSADLADDGSAIIAWVVDNGQTTGLDLLQARWLLPDGSLSPLASVTGAAFGEQQVIRAVLNGSGSSWLVYVTYSGGPVANGAVSFAKDGTLGTPESIPSPSTKPEAPILAAAGPNDELGVAYSFPVGERDEGGGVSVRLGS